jgi:hypothetical protein
LKKINLWLAVFLPAIFLLSCRTDQEPLPANPDDIPFNMVADSLEVVGGTVLFDSIQTSFADQILTGQIKDTRFGTGKAIAYFQLLPTSYPREIPDFNAGFKLDSVNIFFLRSTYYPFQRSEFPGELQKQKLNLYALKAAPPGSKSYYSIDTLEIDRTNLLAQTRPRGIDIGAGTFILSATGEGLMNLFKSGFSGKTLLNDQDVLSVLPGLAIMPDDSTTKLFSLRVDQTGGIDDILMKLNYSNNEGRDSLFFALRRQGSVYFSHFKFNRQGTPFEALQKGELLPVEATSGVIGSQKGSGIRSWINFSNLEQKKAQLGNVTVLKGEIEIIPEYDPVFVPTPFLNMVASKTGNLFPGRGQDFNQLLLNENILVNIADTSNLSIRSNPSNFLFTYDAAKNRYICNITGYLRRLMANPQLSQGILVNVPFAATGFDGLTYKPKGGIKVKLFYKKPD